MLSVVSFSSPPFGPKINVYHHRVNYVADVVMIVVIEKHTIFEMLVVRMQSCSP